MALKVALKCDCGFRYRDLAGLSELVAHISGRPLPDEKPVVGSAAFRHESGIHCGGLLKDPRTYEPFKPPRKPATRRRNWSSAGIPARAFCATSWMRWSFPCRTSCSPNCWRKSAGLPRNKKHNITDEELKTLVNKFQKNHGLPDL